ncbi:MAG TPA: RNA-binding protein [Xanthobacteraceae bacterium]|jgi:hypothetical protein
MLAQAHHETLDAGPRKRASATERFCVATGAVRPTEQMIRFVLGPDGTPVPDLRRRLPGRGAWVTATRDALSIAIARRAFARAFRREVRVADDLLATTERLLERSALDALAIAHKAGAVAAGFTSVEAALARDPVLALLHAVEAAPDGRRKLAAAQHRRADAGEIVLIEGFTTAQLDLALGRSNVIHAALLAGPEGATFLARTARLECFRTGELPDAPGIRHDRTRRAASSPLRRDGMTKRGEEPKS